jgi:hypothetical protein
VIPTDTAEGTPVIHRRAGAEVASMTTSAPYEDGRRGRWKVDLLAIDGKRSHAVPVQDVDLAQLSLL